MLEFSTIIFYIWEVSYIGFHGYLTENWHGWVTLGVHICTLLSQPRMYNISPNPSVEICTTLIMGGVQICITLIMGRGVQIVQP